MARALARFVFARAHAVDRDGLRLNLDEEESLLRRTLQSIAELELISLSLENARGRSAPLPAAVLHIAAHAHPSGIVIDGGGLPHAMTLSDLRSFVDSHQPGLVVLSSGKLGLTLAQAIAGTAARHVIVV